MVIPKASMHAGAGDEPGMAHNGPSPRASPFLFCVLVLEIAMILIYATVTEFAPALGTQMLLGFGFLYAAHRHGAWSGITLNALVAVTVLQAAPLLNGLWENVHEARVHPATSGFPSLKLNVGSFVRADYSAATVLISFGALLGRVSPTQLLVLAMLEIIASTGNEAVGALALKVTDPGGSMYIHAFGAAFGLAASWAYGDLAAARHVTPATSRTNATFAMIGTLFLWCFWPSFNGAMLVGSGQHRAVINTLLAISGSFAAALAVSRFLLNGRRFDMEHVQNATLAGGVVIGAACDMLASPWGAILAGAVAGAVSTLGFTYLTPFLYKRGLTDTCGILNLHFLPGVIGGIASAIAAAGVSDDGGVRTFTTLGMRQQFPGRVERSALTQGAFQMAVTVISVALGACAGALGGWIIRSPVCEPKTDGFYEDAADWHMPFEDALSDSHSSVSVPAGVEAGKDADVDARIRFALERWMAAHAVQVHAAPDCSRTGAHAVEVPQSDKRAPMHTSSSSEGEGGKGGKGDGDRCVEARGGGWGDGDNMENRQKW